MTRHPSKATARTLPPMASVPSCVKVNDHSGTGLLDTAPGNGNPIALKNSQPGLADVNLPGPMDKDGKEI